MHVVRQMTVVARHQIQHCHAVAHEASGEFAPDLAGRGVEMVDQARLGIEGRIVGIRLRIGLGEVGKPCRMVPAAGPAVFQGIEQWQIAGAGRRACIENPSLQCSWRIG